MVSAATVTDEEDCSSASWEDPAGDRGLGKPLGRHLIDRIWLGPKASNPEVPKDLLIIWKSSSLYDRLSQGELGVILIPSVNLRSTHQRVVKPSLPIWGSPENIHEPSGCGRSVKVEQSHFLFMGLSPTKDVRMNESFWMKPQQRGNHGR